MHEPGDSCGASRFDNAARSNDIRLFEQLPSPRYPGSGRQMNDCFGSCNRRSNRTRI
jgi:hypothetical protein